MKKREGKIIALSIMFTALNKEIDNPSGITFYNRDFSQNDYDNVIHSELCELSFSLHNRIKKLETRKTNDD